jgi:hypothetical protein
MKPDKFPASIARALLGVPLLLSFAVVATAVVIPQDDDGPLHRLVRSDLALVPSPSIEPFKTVASELDPGVRSAWSGFVNQSLRPGGWNAQVDRRSGLVEVAEGAGVPWIPGHGNDLRAGDIAAHLRGRGEPVLDTLESIARSFLPRVAPTLGADHYELRLDRGASGRHADYLWVVEFDVYVGGVAIEGASVFFHVNNGNLVQFGAQRVPQPGTSVPVAAIDRDSAFAFLDSYVGGFIAGTDWLLDPGRLLLLPTRGPEEDYSVGRGYGLLPVWEFTFRRGDSRHTWRARVDALSGEVLEFRDTNRYAQVTGGYWPISWRVNGVEQSQVISGWPFTTVNPLATTSNTSGVYAFDGNPQTARHVGPYVNVDDQCAGAPGTRTSDGSGNIAFGQIVLGSAPGDCEDQAGVNDNSPSARQQFWHTNKIMEKARSYFPGNAWLNAQLGVNVNIDANCNAFWNGSTTNFFTSGGGCGNTGEDVGVSMHEWGHGWDSNDGNGSSLENGTGETVGDFTAALQTFDSCVGQGFLGGNCGGYGNACNSCDGVRDIDWGDHADNVPWTVEDFTHQQCPCDRPPGGFICNGTYNGPCGINFGTGVNNKEGHCESYVSSGALFDFANYDLRSGCGGRDSTNFPDWNCPGAGGPYTIAGAFGVADRLWYLSSPIRNQAFTCNTGGATWTSHGCNAGSNFKAMRLVDDDDGNLANGTPHSCQLAAAFDRHGIACTTDTAYDTCFRGCTQPAAPSLNVPGVGNHLLRLDWTPDTGSDVVDVFRNESGCGFGFTKIAEDIAFGSLPFFDTTVANGTTYYYQVVRHPVGNEACGSAPSNCVSGLPTAGPSAKYIQSSVSLDSVPSDNDSDGFVDNCDTGRLRVGIVNDGNAALTNTRFTVTSPDAEVTIVSAMPVNVGTLAQNSQTTGTFDFSVEGASCGQILSFNIAVTADEMTGSSPDSFTYGPVEQDLSLTTARTDDFETDSDGWTFIQGYARENVTADSGSWSVHSSSGLNNQIDAALSPVFQKGAGATQVVLAERHDIEEPFWDRANVPAIKLSDGSHTLLTPTGRTYTPGGPWNPVGHVGTEPGWAGTNLTWGDATFDLSVLDPNESYQLEINYNTDAAVVEDGHWFDNVRWTNVSFQICDAGGDSCGPNFSKTFAPDAIEVDGTSTLTFTVDNSTGTSMSTTLDFTDNLPAGVVVETPPGDSKTCSGGTITAVAGSGVISYTGGSVGSGATCTVSVDVTSDVIGDHVNVSGDLTSSACNSGPATDTLTVNCSGFPDQVLENDTLTSTLVVQACNLITVGPAYTVQAPADLTLRVGGRVVFVNDVAIEGGTVVVENAEPQ